MTVEAPPQTAPSGSRAPLRTRRVWVIVIAAVLVATAIPTWTLLASRASNQVHVVPGTDSMVCNGKEVPYRITGSDGDEPRPAFVIPIKKGMTCHFSVTVVNHSGHSVTVRDLTFPGLRLGPGNSGPVVIQGLDPSQRPHGSSDNSDAVYDLDESIPAGELDDFQFLIVANPRACSSAGTAFLSNFPAAHLSVLRQHRTVHGDMSIDVRVTKRLTRPGC